MKVGHGPHYVCESKEVVREDDNQLRIIYPGRADIVNINTRNKKTLSHTDSWLERHFGSTSSLSLSSAGSGGGGGLTRSASVCDIRPVTSNSNVYYATVEISPVYHSSIIDMVFQVRKTGKIPEVKLREKSEKNYYTANRVSAHFSSSGHPIRPPRKTKKSHSDQYSSYGQASEDAGRWRGERYYYGSLHNLARSSSFVNSIATHQRHHMSQPNPSHRVTRDYAIPITREVSSGDNKGMRGRPNAKHSDTVASVVPKRRSAWQYQDYQDQTGYSTPHRIIYTMDAPVGASSTKYRTRIVINGDGL